MGDGRLLFSVGGTVVFREILIQGERGVRCANMNGHNDADTKAAEKINQNHFVQCTRREKLDGRVNAWRVSRRHKGNAVRRVRCSEIRIVWQPGCFAGQSWFGIWCRTGW
uniref:Uncharacterized protein n=1 Tax=Romanomermis culicivorax TaxID=13658 RepID=A0A915L1Q2_ROMCU